MNLYFLRHAKAYPRRKKFTPDSKRPLTPDGEKQMQEVAGGMKELGLEFDLILTSPYVRALRTAEIAAEVFKSKKLKITENLISEADPKKIINEINAKYFPIKNIALVGHEPFLSQLMSVLLTGGSDLKINFKKAGLGKLSMEDLRFGKCACLEWLLTPRQLARIAIKT